MKRRHGVHLRAGRGLRIWMCAVALSIAMSLCVPCMPGALAAEDGMVRVHLTQLGSIGSLAMTTTCTYYVNGDKGKPIPNGARVDVTLANGTLSYQINGEAKLIAGDKLTLSRGKAGAHGLKFVNPSLANLFCGDLQLSIASGKIKPVLNIYIEDYLYGVVAYEMSDSFPLEALKAQAVAARNYAISSRKGAGTHDLTDNTNSQVFKGYKADHKNVIRAVNETKGVCALYNGKLIECFYGSSNGGQIDTAKNVWGSALGYSVMKDDPYDLENPSSALKTLSVVKKPTAKNPLNAKLKAELVQAMADQLTKNGLKTDADDVTIASVNSVTPHTPRYPEPSRTFTKLRFSLNVSGISAETGAAVTLDKPIEVDLLTYGSLKSKFSLGHQSANAEIISVSSDSDAFAIEFRRWGHGVGMSQRGAQWMAKNYGKTYKEILKFYFNGIELRDMNFRDTTMTS